MPRRVWQEPDLSTNGQAQQHGKTRLLSAEGTMECASAKGNNMDYQSFVNTVSMPCCILSVEKTPQGGCGQIRILCSNQPYKETMGPKVYDNMPYYELVPKDNKFEHYCFQAAHRNQRMHAYVETKALGGWTDQTMIPLAGGDDRIGYCQYIFEFTKTAEPERMSKISAATASAVIESCVKLTGTEDFRASVDSVLEDIVDFSGAIAGRIMIADEEKREAVIFSDVMKQDIWPERNPENDVITYDLIRTWEELIAESNAVIVRDDDDLKELEAKDPLWVQTMRAHRISSLALVPMRKGKVTVGYLYVVNFNTEKYVEVKEMIELTAFLLASEISNYLFFQRLETMSLYDDLTGLMNRHALMKRVNELEKAGTDCTYGIINVDLNGLKRINDTEGHVFGDSAITRMAEILRHVFRDPDLFRIGGDEFIVLITGIAEDVFSRRVEYFRDNFQNREDVSFSMGSYWCDGSIVPDEAFQKADRNMYEDKDRFYGAHPEWRH